MSDLFHLRREFELHRLDDADTIPDPFDLFEIWFGEALRSGEPEANAMVLATVSDTGQPSSRIVLLKSFDEQGFVFFTNFESRKGNEIDFNNKVALLFFWPLTQRQIRVEGEAAKVPDLLSDRYFRSRPEGSRISAVASPQSRVIGSRRELEQRYFDTERNADLYAVRPENWGGYVVKASMLEFWQGRENRLHDRICYTNNSGQWLVERLAP
ncbi:MAG: pyridoxamine 5'-phosphate oxidase [Bacteroidales bacterium]|nr:pyridoxamine 5'-phosphate oxidase [Bacteroidales bacterium]